jgi:mutator protein MutT
MKIVNIALAAVVRDRKLLICRRHDDAPVLPGYWELPGGKIEPLESPADAALRELQEETGIAATILRPLHIIEHTYDHATVRLHPLLCQHLTGEAQALGCAEVRWIPPADLPHFRFPEANATLLKDLPQAIADLAEPPESS